MFKKRILVVSFTLVSLFLIATFLVFESEGNVFTKMVTISDNRRTENVEELEIIEVNTNEEEVTNVDEDIDETTEEVEPEIVYEGKTLDEVAEQLDRSLANELSGKGYLYATYCLDKGVDPYLAVAISLEETGCKWGCSGLVTSCNNVGGMKGSGCGSYGYFDTLDDGIRAFIDNIERNYVAYGLTTAELMNPKYAENPAWASNVNSYINRIKNG